ncbi:hypothetical protein [Pseudomonas peli]|uniref:hypothetical protein n=1 Tax=Pseudomonas peli TaxID=592361 RepID=UPI0024ACC956|nr:hypothetical protein [Pseudomonas peli]
MSLPLIALPSLADPSAPADARQQVVDFDLPPGPLEQTLTGHPPQWPRHRLQCRLTATSRPLPWRLHRAPLGAKVSSLHRHASGTECRAAQLHLLHVATAITGQAYAQDAWGPAHSRVAQRSAQCQQDRQPLSGKSPRRYSVVPFEEFEARQSDSLWHCSLHRRGGQPAQRLQPGGRDYRLRGFDIGPRTGGVLGENMQSAQFEKARQPYGLGGCSRLASSRCTGQLAPGG